MCVCTTVHNMGICDFIKHSMCIKSRVSIECLESISTHRKKANPEVLFNAHELSHVLARFSFILYNQSAQTT